MEKVRVRYVIKTRRTDPVSEFDHHYEVNASKRENLSSILEKKLDHSLNELEKTLKKRNPVIDS